MIESRIQYKIFPDRIRDGPKFPTAFLLASGCVKCQSSPSTVSRPSGCEIERVWPNCPRRILPLVCSETMPLMSKWKPAKSSLARNNALFRNVPMSISGAGLA
jgi:hypothetical protein